MYAFGTFGMVISDCKLVERGGEESSVNIDEERDGMEWVD